MIPLTDKDKQRFLIKMPERPAGQCWQWGSYKDQCGYGKFKICGKHYMAHRIAYQLFVGPVPRWATVLRHSCDNPSCVNPAHLQPGTQKDNARDRKVRGREGKHHGELNGRRVIPEAAIALIRARHKGGEKYKEIAAEFGVTPQNIYRIVHRKTWKHVGV